MKNLIKAIETEEKKRLEDFIFSINQISPENAWDLKLLDTWQYNDLLPKGKDVSKFSFSALRGYLIMRKEKAIYKAIEREVSKINTVAKAGELISVKITVEWKKNRMWGSNPTAEAWCQYIDETGNTNSHYAKSGSIGGCGYDKQSTAVSECLNQFNEVLKLLYTAKNKNVTAKNNDLLGYGSGYGILPSIEGGVGVSCYPRIFELLGYSFKTVASGKSFDAYSIEKINK